MAAPVPVERLFPHLYEWLAAKPGGHILNAPDVGYLEAKLGPRLTKRFVDKMAKDQLEMLEWCEKKLKMDPAYRQEPDATAQAKKMQSLGNQMKKTEGLFAPLLNGTKRPWERFQADGRPPLVEDFEPNDRETVRKAYQEAVLPATFIREECSKGYYYGVYKIIDPVTDTALDGRDEYKQFYCWLCRKRYSLDGGELEQHLNSKDHRRKCDGMKADPSWMKDYVGYFKAGRELLFTTNGEECRVGVEAPGPVEEEMEMDSPSPVQVHPGKSTSSTTRGPPKRAEEAGSGSRGSWEEMMTPKTTVMHEEDEVETDARYLVPMPTTTNKQDQNDGDHKKTLSNKKSEASSSNFQTTPSDNYAEEDSRDRSSSSATNKGKGKSKEEMIFAMMKAKGKGGKFEQGKKGGEDNEEDHRSDGENNNKSYKGKKAMFSGAGGGKKGDGDTDDEKCRYNYGKQGKVVDEADEHKGMKKGVTTSSRRYSDDSSDAGYDYKGAKLKGKGKGGENYTAADLTSERISDAPPAAEEEQQNRGRSNYLHSESERKFDERPEEHHDISEVRKGDWEWQKATTYDTNYYYHKGKDAWSRRLANGGKNGYTPGDIENAMETKGQENCFRIFLQKGKWKHHMAMESAGERSRAVDVEGKSKGGGGPPAELQGERRPSSSAAPVEEPAREQTPVTCSPRSAARLAVERGVADAEQMYSNPYHPFVPNPARNITNPGDQLAREQVPDYCICCALDLVEDDGNGQQLEDDPRLPTLGRSKISIPCTPETFIQQVRAAPEKFPSVGLLDDESMAGISQLFCNAYGHGYDFMKFYKKLLLAKIRKRSRELAEREAGGN